MGYEDTLQDAGFVVALVGRTHDPVLAGFAKRLAAKKPKVILVARMPKVIAILNAMIGDWHATPTQTKAA